jgi:hypothetical protein
MKIMQKLLPLFLFAGFLNLGAAAPDWKIPVGRENAMVVYAIVVDQADHEFNTPSSLLGAYEWGIIAGVTPVSTGPKGKLYQLKVGSDTWESELSYQLYDAGKDRVMQLKGGPVFVAGSTVGSIANPVKLTVVK